MILVISDSSLLIITSVKTDRERKRVKERKGEKEIQSGRKIERGEIERCNIPYYLGFRISRDHKVNLDILSGVSCYILYLNVGAY